MAVNERRKTISLVFGGFLMILFSTGTLYAAARVGTGVFPDAQTIEAELVRGQSTRFDVQKLLGIPSGAGGALLPGFGDNSQEVAPYDVWYYEDLEAEKFKSESGVLIMDLRQQIIVIFFKGDKYHGYFWTTNKSALEDQ